LRQFCDPPLSSQELAERLTMAGLEVEELRPFAAPCSGVVVGAIRACAPHPNADRLRVCQVDVGAHALLTIVCGAPNARVGLKAPCALVGALLPPGADGQPFAIKASTLRGVPSAGMLCSARELGLGEDHSGLLELAGDAPPGQDIRQCLDLDDMLFTLKLTPNLAHCLSVYGVAREVAALTGAPLKTPTFTPAAVQTQERLPVRLDAPDLCGRFCGRVVRGLNPRAPTPAWMLARLARCGQRSVSALVDISNYVMFELGRPTHMFDLDKIHGALHVRWGRAGEQLKLLNGNTVVVDENVGVIADTRQVESLAGIMGGDATAVGDATCNIYIEAAFWWPAAVAGRSRRYHFATEAGHRFERGVDPHHLPEHLERITQLVLDICGTPHTQCGPIDDQQPNMPAAPAVALRVARAAKVLGMPVSTQQCRNALTALGLDVQEKDAGTLTVTPPSWRFDIAIEEDLIEEVARVIGYDQLPETAPLAPLTPLPATENRRSPFALRRALAAQGYQETINFSFVPPAWERDLAGNATPVQLLNPIASQLSAMRSSLIGSLLHVLRFNADRKAEQLRVFEIGRVFLHDAQVSDSDTSIAGIHQPMRVAALAWGSAAPLQWGGARRTRVDFYDAKGDLEALLAPRQAVFEAAEHPALHPGRCARVLLHGRAVGFVGELHPRWCQQWDFAQPPVLFELELEALLARALAQCAPVNKYPLVERDMAVVLPEHVTHAQLMRAIDSADTAGTLRAATLFDIYRAAPGEHGTALQAGEKSLAVRLSLGSDSASLTEAQIEHAVQAILESLQGTLQARLRT